jgi:hypothetical protein
LKQGPERGEWVRKTFWACFVIAVMMFTGAAKAQSGPDEGSRDLQIWTSGGHGLTGSTSSTELWNVGLRYGWVLTGPHGPGLLNGNFEYAVDVVPVFVVFQPANTAYGFGLNPIALKWNFAPGHNVRPYLEIGGGTLFTNDQVPSGASRVNFTSGGALGMYFLRNKYNVAAEVRFMHISNASIADHNPGINTVQFRLGFGLFTHHK